MSKQSVNSLGKVKAVFSLTLICLPNLICIITPRQPLVPVCTLLTYMLLYSFLFLGYTPLMVLLGYLQILLQNCLSALSLLGRYP